MENGKVAVGGQSYNNSRCYFCLSELFNQTSRPAAASVAVTVNWAANFIVGLSFLPLQVRYQEMYLCVVIEKKLLEIAYN